MRDLANWIVSRHRVQDYCIVLAGTRRPDSLRVSSPPMHHKSSLLASLLVLLVEKRRGHCNDEVLYCNNKISMILVFGTQIFQQLAAF